MRLVPYGKLKNSPEDFRPLTRRFGRTLTAALFALAAGGAAFAATPAAHSALPGKADLFVTRQAEKHSSTGWASVIVRFSGDLTTGQQEQLKALQVDVYRHLPIIQSAAVRVPGRNLDRLAALPFVTRLSSDLTVRKCDEFTVQHSGADIAFSQYKLDGSGVTVAVIDSGIHNVEDLKNSSGVTRVNAQVAFVPGDGSTDDKCGHGTHVAGIIAGSGRLSTGTKYIRTFYGIARNANIINVRALDQQGSASVSTVVSAIQWVVTNRVKYGIRVLNLSLGHPVGESYTSDPLCQAAETAWKNGIVVVCAAGNDGRLNAGTTAGDGNEGYGVNYGSIQSPGNDPYVITVGAMKNPSGDRENDCIATYSSRGPSRLDYVLKPDLAAPGNKIISLDGGATYLEKSFGNSNDIPFSTYVVNGSSTLSNNYYVLSGTSMATPVVSGAAALILQKDPSLSPDTIKARLMMSADKWTDASGNSDPFTYGAGYLNIPAALNSTVVAGQPALSPTLSQDAFGNVYINLNASIWGSKAIWGTGVTDLRAVWGTRAIWGSSLNLLNASNAIWGTSVWSDRAVWGVSTSQADLSTYATSGE